jgi:hypothetical protein
VLSSNQLRLNVPLIFLEAVDDALDDGRVEWPAPARTQPLLIAQLGDFRRRGVVEQAVDLEHDRGQGFSAL